MAEEFNDLILQYLATSAPSPSAGELFDTASQAAKVQDLWGLAQQGAQFIPQPRKEKQLAAFPRFRGEPSQIRLCDAWCSWPGYGLGRLSGEGKATQHLFQGPGELAERHGLALQLVFKIMENSLRRVPDKFRVEQRCGVSH
jgi:hypothetical protein